MLYGFDRGRFRAPLRRVSLGNDGDLRTDFQRVVFLRSIQADYDERNLRTRE